MKFQFPVVVFKIFSPIGVQQVLPHFCLLSAHQMARAGDARDTLEGFFIDEAGGVWMRTDTGLWLLLDTDTVRGEPG